MLQAISEKSVTGVCESGRYTRNVTSFSCPMVLQLTINTAHAKSWPVYG